jgi:flavin reductase (DIM6/NTAB) family NADH-FMN oxidoreductase RutF
VNPENFSYTLLQQSGGFAVSILRQGQLELARHFGTQSGREVDKLTGQRWRPGTLGAPVLLDAAAYLECRVVDTTDAGDHKLVLGRVTGGQLLELGAVPLLYADTDDIDGSSALYPGSF